MAFIRLGLDKIPPQDVPQREGFSRAEEQVLSPESAEAEQDLGVTKSSKSRTIEQEVEAFQTRIHKEIQGFQHAIDTLTRLVPEANDAQTAEPSGREEALFSVNEVKAKQEQLLRQMSDSAFLYKRITGQAESQIREFEKMDFQELGAIDAITRHISDVAEELSIARQQAEALSRAEQHLHVLQDQYRTAKIREAGFEDPSDLFHHKLDLKRQEWKLPYEWAGLGKYVHKKRLVDLQKRIIEIDELENMPSRADVPDLEVRMVGYDIDSLSRRLSLAVEAKVLEQCGRLVEQRRAELAESGPVLSKEAVASLNNMVIEAHIKPKLIDIQQQAIRSPWLSEQQMTELSDPALVERAANIIRQSFDIPMSLYSKQTGLLAKELNEQIFQMPEQLRDKFFSCLNSESSSDEPVGERFQRIAAHIRQAPQVEKMIILSREVGAVLSHMETFMGNMGLRDRSDTLGSARIYNRISATLKPASDFAVTVDIARWDALKGSTEAELVLDSGQVEYAEGVLRELLVRSQLQERADSPTSEHIQERLKHFVAPDTAPFIVMNAYRNSLVGGTDRSNMASTINSWPSEVKSEMSAHGMSGMGELIRLAAEHPDDFSKDKVVNPELVRLQGELTGDVEFLDAVIANTHIRLDRFIVGNPEDSEMEKHGISFDDENHIARITPQTVALYVQGIDVRPGTVIEPGSPEFQAIQRGFARKHLKRCSMVREGAALDKIAFHSSIHDEKMTCFIPSEQWQYFLKKFNHTADLDNTSEVPNPVFTKVQSAVAEVGTYYLRQPERGVQSYAASVLENLSNLEHASYAAFEELLAANGKSGFGNGIAAVLMNRVTTKLDDEAAGILARHYDQLGSETRLRIKGSLHTMVADLARDTAAVGSSRFQLGCDVLEIAPAELSRVLQFIRETKEIGGRGPDSQDDVERYREMAANSAIVRVGKQLHAYGYEFSSGHIKIFPELISRHQAIIAEIENIRSKYPSFDYKLYPDFDGKFQIDPSRQLIDNFRVVGKELDRSLAKKPALNSKNWAGTIAAYVMQEEELYREFTPEASLYLKNVFGPDQPQNKEFCLEQLRKNYVDSLQDSGGSPLSLDVRLMLSAIEKGGGAGVLKYIELLGEHMAEVDKMLSSDDYSESLKQAVRANLTMHEQRFVKERWSEEDRSVFYGISKDILRASPVIYGEVLDVAANMSPKELGVFVKDYLPLYQARLVLMQKGDAQSRQYDSSGLLVMQKELSDMSMQLSTVTDSEQRNAIWNSTRTKSLDYIQTGFKERFGLLKTPESWEGEKIRFVQNFVRYLGNISHADEKKENLIAGFLALNINGEWDKLRRNESIDMGQYFTGERGSFLKEYMKLRAEGNVVTAGNFGVTPEQFDDFQRVLQEETIEQFLGNVQTIDEKLGVVARSLEELGDEDAYPNELDRRLLRLTKQHGKRVGVALAGAFNRLQGRHVAESEQDVEILGELRTAFGKEELSADDVKMIQDRIKPVSLVVNVLGNLEGRRVHEEIDELRKRLSPPPEVVTIFNTIGESFQPESGALALSQDLAYLENIIVKNGPKLEQSQQECLHQYLHGIREQMQKLESLYLEFTEQVHKIQKSAHVGTNELLASRVDEVAKIVDSKESVTEVVSRATNNFNWIIENMRQCLGCMKKEINNDTNLTFGDANKFYLMSQTSSEKGSVADEIVFLCPVQTGPDQQEMALVMDQVYGNKSSDILLSHVKVLVKKMDQLKKQYPQAKLSIVVSDTAMASVGLNESLLRNKIEGIGIQPERAVPIPEVLVTIPASAGGDHYIEFGSAPTGGTHARLAGPRKTGGVMIK